MLQKIFSSAFLFFAISILTAKGQTLFTLKKTPVSVQEFEAAYKKNKKQFGQENVSVDEYLQTFIHYKLKLQAAKDARYDTLESLKADINSFAEQIKPGYLYDVQTLQNLIDTAKKRSTENKHVIILYLPAPKNYSDSLLYIKARAQANQIIPKHVSIDELYSQTKELYKPTRLIDAGYKKVFDLPYTIENIVYNTPTGGISKAYINKNGTYFFNVSQTRPDIGEWQLRQILIGYNPKADYKDTVAAKRYADSIYQLILQKSISFDDAVQKYSQDVKTKHLQGNLAPMTSGSFAPAFEQEILTSLQKNNAVTTPIRSNLGYHILQRVTQKNLNYSSDTFFNQKTYHDWVVNSDRYFESQQVTAKSVEKKLGFKQYSVTTPNIIYWYADSIFQSNTTNIKPTSAQNNTELFSFNDGTKVPVQNWLNFVQSEKNMASLNGSSQSLDVQHLLNKFKTKIILENYAQRLGELNTTYKQQLEEYINGSLLFEFMNKHFWQNTPPDSALQNLYHQNAPKYIWDKSATVSFYQVPSTIVQKLSNSPYISTSEAEAIKSSMKVSMGRYELPQLAALLPVAEFKENDWLLLPESNQEEGNLMTVIFIDKIFPAGMQKSFEDARGLLVSDFQQNAETNLLNNLYKTYQVQLNTQEAKKLQAKYK